MQQEKSNEAVIDFYKNHRLPQLAKEIIEACASTQTSITVKAVLKLIEEYNQGLNLVHGENAANLPHYVLEVIQDTHQLKQFIPALAQPNPQENSQQFIDGPTKATDDEDQSPFDISFLSESLRTLAGKDDQDKLYDQSDAPFEITIYDAQDLDEDYLYQFEPPSYHAIFENVQQDAAEDEDFEDYSGVEVFFDEDIPPGMLLVELYNPISDEIDVLYIPHTSINFPFIILLMEEYIGVGGAVGLTFSKTDYDNNLIIPIDPTNPDSDRPINPLLN